MITHPKTWRLEAGLSLSTVAKQAGIAGANPARTYDRYERGESVCPADVIERVRAMSDGKVDAESWQSVRLAHIHASANSAEAARL